MRTHRRTQSYEVSQTNTDFMSNFPTPNHPLPQTSRSLRRDAFHHPSMFNSSGSVSQAPGHVTVGSTQDSGITSVFDSRSRSASGYSLSSSSGSQTRPPATKEEMGMEVWSS